MDGHLISRRPLPVIMYDFALSCSCDGDIILERIAACLFRRILRLVAINSSSSQRLCPQKKSSSQAISHPFHHAPILNGKFTFGRRVHGHFEAISRNLFRLLKSLRRDTGEQKVNNSTWRFISRLTVFC